MALIEIMSSAFTQYRSGLVYAVQYGDYGAAILFIKAMSAILPPNFRPALPPIPTPKDLSSDLQDKNSKWDWCQRANYLMEEAISKWIYSNLARMNM